MKALVYTQYGSPDVLRLQEVEKPVPGDGEILVKVYATTVNRTDYATVAAIPFFARLITGLFKPRKPVPGTEFAGEVEAVGTGVTTLRPGDRVFGFDDSGTGSHAQYLAIKDSLALSIPGDLSYAQAAASSEGLHYAKNFVNKVVIKEGDRVLVNGATGAIGSAAVQLLKSLGVTVTAVCSTPNIELVASLGADRVIDYTREDFTEDDGKYTCVFDAVGKSSFFKCKRLLLPGGVYISSDLGYLAQNIFLPLVTPVISPLLGRRKTAFPIPVDIPGSLALVKGLIEKGQFTAVIDRTYSLEQIVDAYRYVAKGRKVGNVVITVAHR